MSIFGAMTGKMVQLGQRNNSVGAVLETPADVSQRRFPMTTPQSTPALETTQEEWRPVVGYEGLYEVSDFGRVRSLWSNRIKRAKTTHNGYLRVGLCRAGTVKWRAVHLLVAAAFLGPCPERMQVNHKDFNPANACVENLEYVTPKANVLHSTLAGRRRYSNLSAQDIWDIRASGEPNRRLALRYGVGVTTIYAIKHRQSYRHIPEFIPDRVFEE